MAPAESGIISQELTYGTTVSQVGISMVPKRAPPDTPLPPSSKFIGALSLVPMNMEVQTRLNPFANMIGRYPPANMVGVGQNGAEVFCVFPNGLLLFPDPPTLVPLPVAPTAIGARLSAALSGVDWGTVATIGFGCGTGLDGVGGVATKEGGLACGTGCFPFPSGGAPAPALFGAGAPGGAPGGAAGGAAGGPPAVAGGGGPGGAAGGTIGQRLDGSGGGTVSVGGIIIVLTGGSTGTSILAGGSAGTGCDVAGGLGNTAGGIMRVGAPVLVIT
jgi:hypothetical protein